MTVFSGWPSLEARLVCRFQVVQTEAEIVQRSLDLLQGKPFFLDYRKGGPILFPPCSVVYYALQSLAMKWVGGLWLPGRLIAFGSYLGCFLLLLRLGYRRWLKYWTAALAALFLLSPTWALWSTVVRTDTLMIFFNFCCLATVTAWIEKTGLKQKDRHPWIWLALAGTFNALALLCKPTAVTTTAAVMLALALKKKWPSGIIFIIFSAGLAGMVMGLLQWITHGLFFMGGFGQETGFSVTQAVYFLTSSFFPEAAWLLAALLLALFSGRMPILWKCQVFFSSLWIFSLGHALGAENYYLEFILFGIAAVGETFGVAPEKSSAPRSWIWSTRLAAGCLVLGFLQMSGLPWPQPPSAGEQAMKSQVIPIYTIPGEHLAVDEDLPLMAGKRVWIQVHGFKELVDSGQIDPSALLRDIRSKFFATVELYDLPRQEFLPEVVVEAIRENYEVRVRRFGRVWLFPRPDRLKGI